MKQGRLFIVSGPSGAGKSTICGQLYKDGDFLPSVSMTTRAMRTGEIPGESYYFVTPEEFQKTIDEGGFLEHAQIYNNCYGTPKAPVIKNLNDGKDVILEIDMQGAKNAKAVFPEAVTVFVLPPSIEALRSRLINRGTENEEQLRIRMQESLAEISRISEYDYYLINDDFDRAVKDLKDIAAGKGNHKVPTDISGIVDKYKEEK